MKQQREKFQVIGSCRKMQTLSLEDEFRRIDGVPYVIDFYQDFSKAAWGNSENKICIPEIIEEIMNPKAIDVQQKSDGPSLEERQQSENFWHLVDKEQKMDIKAKKKWEKHHRKVSDKQAIKNFKRVYREVVKE